MNLKEIKKLAAVCRKAGIKHFKSQDFEFTLTEDVPVSSYRRKKGEKVQSSQVDTTPFSTDSLSDEELMYWSVGNINPDSETPNG